MLLCGLCEGILSSLQELVGTSCCRVLYHRECLDYYIITRSAHCPLCKKNIKAYANDATFGPSQPSIFALHPYGSNTGHACRTIADKNYSAKNESNSFVHGIMQENVVLKSKLTKAILTMLIAQSGTFSGNKPTSTDYAPANLANDLIILGVDKSRLSGRNVSAATQMVVRSNERKYLTFRNKAQSWLSKMLTATRRLLEAEKEFTREEYVQQLHFFANKIYRESEIIEKTKQAASLYAIIGELSDAETNAIHDKVTSLAQQLLEITLRIMNRIQAFERFGYTKVETRLTDGTIKGSSDSQWSRIPQRHILPYTRTQCTFVKQNEWPITGREMPFYNMLTGSNKSSNQLLSLLIYLEKSGNAEIFVSQNPVFV